MKIPCLFTFTFFCFSSFSQTTTIEFENLSNKYEVNLQTKDDGTLVGYVSDLQNPKNAKSFSMSVSDDVSLFIDHVRSNALQITKTFNFRLTKEIFYPLDSLNTSYDNINLSTLSKENLKDLIRSKLLYLKEGKSFSEFTEELQPSISQTLFNNLNEFKLQKTEDSEILLTINFEAQNNVSESEIEVKKTTINDEYIIKTEEQLLDSLSLKELYLKNIKQLIISVDSLEKIKKFSILKTDRKKLSEFYEKFLGESDFKFLDNLSLKLKNPDKQKVFEVNIKSNTIDKHFKLRICDNDYNCGTGQNLPFSTSLKTFENLMDEIFNDLLTGRYDSIEQSETERVYSKIKEYNTEQIVQKRTDIINAELKSTLEELENLKESYSGSIKLNKVINVYKKLPDSNKSKYKQVDKLNIDYATIRVFKNKIRTLTIVGSINGEEVVVTNRQFSMALKYFNQKGNWIPISSNKEDSLYITLMDVASYIPYNNNFNNAASNGNYRIEADSIKHIKENSLLDYFNAVIFLDFLGLNDTSSNSLIQAEGRLRIPLYIYNSERVGWISNLNVDLNATLYNGFDESARFIKPTEKPKFKENSTDLESVTINVFDYIKNNNLNAGISMDVVGFELHSLSSDLTFQYGLRYYRAGLKYTDTETIGEDVDYRYQLNALTHEIGANLEIRPQVNFGADLNLSYNWINARGSLKDLDIAYNRDDGNSKRGVFRIFLNTYFKSRPDKTDNGIYARIGGFHHFGSKEFYPQILVGYATNLSSLVNKFNKNK